MEHLLPITAEDLLEAVGGLAFAVMRVLDADTAAKDRFVTALDTLAIFAEAEGRLGVMAATQQVAATARIQTA